MREFKFRAWDKKKKVMVPHEKLFRLDCSNEYPFLALLRNMYSDAIVPFDVEIMQYTGLKDRNNRNVYEGDFVKITFDQSYIDKPFYIGVVAYRADEGYPAFDLEPWIDYGMNALAWLKSESDPSVISYEVIGNIFEDGGLVDDCKKSKDD